MTPRFALCRMRQDVLAARLPAGADVARAGQVALIAWPAAELERRGAIAGAFAGVVFDHVDHRERLVARGQVVGAGAHALAAAVVAGEGARAVGAMRWQGVLAALHLGERRSFAARDPMGVGGLWCGQAGGAVVLASDRTLCAHLLPDAVAALVPAGVLAALDDAVLRFEPLRVADSALPFLRRLPAGVPVADADAALAGLRARLQAAFAAAADAGPGFVVPAPATAAARWLADLAGVHPGGNGNLVGAWDGCETVVGSLHDSPADWQPPPAPCPRPAPPEPLTGVDAHERRQRELRATWLSDGILEAARADAVAAGHVVCAPHLDPGVLAWAGAWPEPLRAVLRQRALVA